jgi:glycosyltransferase involved in cell wall biosynthesis
LRPYTLAAEIRRASADTVIFRYAGFPFFWGLDDNRMLARAHRFVRQLRSLLSGRRIILDILDLVRHESPDPQFEVRLDPQRFLQFEQDLFALPTEIWACSYRIAKEIEREYGVSAQAIKVVLNGNFREPQHDPAPLEGTVHFAYAGDLSQGWRGNEITLDGFTAENGPKVSDLILCGIGGEWVPRQYPNPRIRYLGSLPAPEVGQAIARARVGVIPHPPHGYYHLAFPTKLGLYINLGMAILTTNAEEPADFVTRQGLGIVVPPDEFGQAMRWLEQNPAEVAKFQKKALILRESFFWDNIYRSAFGTGF